MAEKRKYSKEVEERYKELKDAHSEVNIEGITILTGNNGSGKSLIRKHLPFVLRDKLGLTDVKETQGMLASTSMDARTSSNPEWGAMSGAMRDDDWVATSQNTLDSIKGLFGAVKAGKKCKYLIIDEYEIGCSEETIIALAQYISKELSGLIKSKKIMGAMIITHSRKGVEIIKHDHFLNIGGMTEDKWLTREIKATDLEKLGDNELFHYIRDNQKD